MSDADALIPKMDGYDEFLREIKGRIQLSFDLTRQSALDIGFDATRWHTTLTKTTILGGSGQALLLENRELALTLGLRWVL